MFMKHYVHFLSPGTMVSEESVREIAGWDVDAAMEMAHGIRERHSATPYGFRFSTRSRTDHQFEPKETARSGLYWLGGKVETLAEVKARATPRDAILISNMEGNGWAKIVTNTNSWSFTYPLGEKDVVLDWTPRPKPDEAAA